MQDDKLALRKDILAQVATIKEVEDFQKLLNSSPDVKEVKTNKLANNSKFLPIGVIERTLDEIFSGIWQVKDFKYQIVVNELVGSLELWVYHPLINQWISRVGCASVPITVKSGTDFTEVRNKYINACVTVMPHLKAECVKNAAKSLGVLFGRSLNRDDDYNVYQSLTEKKISQETTEDAELKIAECNTTDQVKDLFKTYPAEVRNNFLFKSMFLKKIKEFSL